MKRDKRTKVFYSIVLSICWMRKRPITIRDLNEFVKATKKQIRKELEILESDERIAKVKIRKGSSGRLCAAWVIADNDMLPATIRNVCQVCGIQKADEKLEAERVCQSCFLAAKADVKRFHMDPTVEAEYSLWLATVYKTPNDGHLLHNFE